MPFIPLKQEIFLSKQIKHRKIGQLGGQFHKFIAITFAIVL